VASWLQQYLPIIREASAFWDVPPAHIAATIEQESGGGLLAGTPDPRQLYRYEPGFWVRYLSGKPEWQPTWPTPTPGELEIWKRRISASYGLMQIMYPTACDHGFNRKWQPERLLDPSENIWLGAKILRHHLDRVDGEWRAAWLRWNGGGRPAYAMEVASKVPRFEGLLRA
jgi:hypothetical protein